MSDSMSRALVFTILRHAEDFPWRMSDIGLLGLRLDENREHRLHVWDPTHSVVADPPIHDHPYSFTSEVIVGEITNTRYTENPAGEVYTRFRYSPGSEDDRRSDTVRLSGTPTTFTQGGRYRQLAPELHSSRQLPGTVTVIRCSWEEGVSDLTVCVRDESSWYSGQARDATRDEIKAVTAKALEWL